jgi:GntR family transcriptional repressor for pyruvate dehydrogenase complex
VATSAPLPQFSIAPREPANVELTRQLLNYLLSGDLHPGQKLPGERALSEALGVGRANLREAIKSLILLGLLEQRQGDGTYLSRNPSGLLPKVIEWGLLLGVHEIEELVEARQHLEVTLAGLAARNRDDEALQRLRAIAEEMKNAGNDYQRYIDADIQFHLEVAKASRNGVLGGVLANIRSLLQVWATRVIMAAQETESSLAMHLPVLEAIEQGDVAKARSTMEALMERASRRLHATVKHETAESSDAAPNS